MLSSQGGQPSSVIQLHRKCYKCGQKGHYAKSCPQNQLSPVAPVQDLSTIPRTSGDKTHLIFGDCSKQDAQNDQAQQQVIPVCSDRTKHEQSKKGPKEYLQGRVHHVSAETIRDNSPVILGMLLVNSFPASVLIDPRATHSFISAQFAAKHGILKLPMRKRMVVKSLEKEQISSYICPRVSMRIGEATFPEDLIVMESTGIDIILGQKWSDRNKLVMQPTKRLIKIQTPSGEQIEHEVQHTSNSRHMCMKI